MATAEATRDFTKETKDLGDKIVELTLKQAKELSDYLEDVHGIKPAAGGAVMMAAPGASAGGGEAPAERLSSTWSSKALAKTRSPLSKLFGPQQAWASKRPRILLKAVLRKSKKGFPSLMPRSFRRNSKKPRPRSALSRRLLLKSGLTG